MVGMFFPVFLRLFWIVSFSLRAKEAGTHRGITSFEEPFPVFESAV